MKISRDLGDYIFAFIGLFFAAFATAAIGIIAWDWSIHVLAYVVCGAVIIVGLYVAYAMVIE